MSNDIRERLERIVAQPSNASTDVDDRFAVVLRTELKRALALITVQAAEIAALKAEIAKLTGRVSDQQKLKRLLGERDEWRQELDNLRRLLRRAERGVAEEHSWYVAAEASLSARTDEIDQLTRLNAAARGFIEALLLVSVS
jgi:chromosome segregation ATPase